MKYLSLYKSILKLGAPILVGQLGTIFVGFADNIMIGKYSTEALASASFVNNIFNMAIFCCMGFTYGILPLVGALYAKGDNMKIGSFMRSASLINVAYSLALTLIMTILYANIERLGQPHELIPIIKPYYIMFLCGIVPIAIFNAFAQCSYGINNTSMPMVIVLISNIINVAGNYVLIYGHFGMPEMGLNGAGLSTLAARLFCAVAIVGWFFFSEGNKQFRCGFVSGTVNTKDLKLIWLTSIPVSMQLAFESGSFSAAAIMSGWLGAIPLAAFQIIVIVGMLGFTLYYAVGSAAAVLVSNMAGNDDRFGMRRAGYAGYHVMLAVATCSSLAFALCGKWLISFFTDDPAVSAAAMALIVPLVLYQLGDATQITFANALRGTSKVMPMLWIAFVSYIVVGIPATYILAFPAGLGLYGIVLSFSVSLFLAGALFLSFFLKATRPRV